MQTKVEPAFLGVFGYYANARQEMTKPSIRLLLAPEDGLYKRGPARRGRQLRYQ